MELIESEHKSSQDALPEPEPRYHTANLPVQKTEHGQAWVRIAAATVLAIILIVLIVLLARWIYHKAHNHASPNPPVSQNTPAAAVNNPPAAPAPNSPSSSSGTAGTSGGSSSNSDNSNSSSPSSGSAAQITNTGPGDVTAIFAGASLAAAGLHYLVSLRRFAKAD